LLKQPLLDENVTVETACRKSGAHLLFISGSPIPNVDETKKLRLSMKRQLAKSRGESNVIPDTSY
jgi:hypothetical protein